MRVNKFIYDGVRVNLYNKTIKSQVDPKIIPKEC